MILAKQKEFKICIALGAIIVFFIAVSTPAFAQLEGVAINGDGSPPDNSSMLEVSSNNRGILIPRLTSAERSAIASPANSLLVFDSDLVKYMFYDAGTSTWKELGGSGTIGAIGPTGNDGATGAVGATGPQGPTGSSGAQGTTGSTGIAGPQGSTGLAGPIGPQGPTGLDGSLNAWSLTGNGGTTTGTNFIGTTDAQDFVIKTNNLEQVRVAVNGNTGIGTSTPTARMHVKNTTGLEQLRLESQYVPSGSSDTSGQIGEITWGKIGNHYYIFLRTADGWRRQKLNQW